MAIRPKLMKGAGDMSSGNEKIYQTVASSGAGNLTLGIIVLVTGLTTGILLSISGPTHLKQKGQITV